MSGKATSRLSGNHAPPESAEAFVNREPHFLQRAVLLLSGLLGFGLLLASWAFLHLFLLAWTEGVLAPWDLVDTNEPPLGTLPRTLNDFFEGPRGAYVPSLLVVVGGALMFALRFARTGPRVAVFWSGVGANVAFLVRLFAAYYSSVALKMLWSWITGTPLLEYRFPFGVFVTTFVLWLGYLAVQRDGFNILTRRSRQKAITIRRLQASPKVTPR